MFQILSNNKFKMLYSNEYLGYLFVLISLHSVSLGGVQCLKIFYQNFRQIVPWLKTTRTFR